jgi:superfamily II DNA or RNA helicase
MSPRPFATPASTGTSSAPTAVISPASAAKGPRVVEYPKCAGKSQDEILSERLAKRSGLDYHQPAQQAGKKRIMETVDEDGRVVRTVGFAAEQLRLKEVALEEERVKRVKEEERLAILAATTTSIVSSSGDGATGEGDAAAMVSDRPIISRLPPSKERNKVYFEVQTDGATRHDATGIVIIDLNENKVMMYDRSGRHHGNRPEPGYDIKEVEAQACMSGATIKVGLKPVVLVTALYEDVFRSGEFFLHAEHEQRKRDDVRKAKEAAIAAKVAVVPRMSFGSKLLTSTGIAGLGAPVFRKRPRDGESGFIVPVAGRSSRSGGVSGCLQELRALHEADREGAVVLFRADYKRDINGRQIVSVVVDPVIGDKLRPHQKIGVQFLYDCITGERMPGYHGAILADEMGLGKTIQTVATVFTCLKQGKHGTPVAEKVVIVAPSSLVANWCNEFEKWLGPGAVKCFAIAESTPKGDRILSRFEGEGDVLVISYDQLRKYVDRLSKMRGVDLVVCDEGHRLKNAEIKTTKAVDTLPTRRRIILSGTPIQNDLSEFHAMVGFVNPGILGNQDLFSRVFEEPIMSGRDPHCPDHTKELGADRAHYLANLTARFILRRTQTINEKYLPAKVDITVFVRLGEVQREIYSRVIELVDTLSSTPLVLITALKKLCNHVDLFREALKDGPKEGAPRIPKSIMPKNCPAGQLNNSVGSKMEFVSLMLDELKSNGDRDKLVIVSNYTQTLEIIAALCNSKHVAFFQLDGSTPIKRRQELVDRFNVPNAQEIVFLLSSKAGGVGLNLIGANRLILFDADWNPANDAQAMGRVWRDGQKKKVFIYRMLCAGTIEEKIYQRQVSKQGLSANVVDMKDDSKQHFSTEDLKQLFAYRPDSLSDTHDLLLCDCQATHTTAAGSAKLQQQQQELKFRRVGAPASGKAATGGPRMDELRSWLHIADVAKFALDKVISNMAARDKRLISFAFANERDAKKYAAAEEVAVDRAFVQDEGNITCCSQTRIGDGDDEDDIEILQDDESSDNEE